MERKRKASDIRNPFTTKSPKTEGKPFNLFSTLGTLELFKDLFGPDEIKVNMDQIDFETLREQVKNAALAGKKVVLEIRTVEQELREELERYWTNKVCRVSEDKPLYNHPKHFASSILKNCPKLKALIDQANHE